MMLRYLVRKVLPEHHIENLKSSREIARRFRRDVIHRCRTRWRTQKPTTVNLLVNDVCNSRCVTCNIWRQAPAPHFSAIELGGILRDPLFSAVRYVGVSGGEPTLRKDLPEIFRTILATLPGLQGTGIITNAYSKKLTKLRLGECASVCESAAVPFHVMVSLDGIGGVHDQVRGKSGSFQNAVDVIRFLRDASIAPVSIGCTISKKNVWDVDNVLEFCISEGIPARFRVAEVIDRLYNKDLTNDIRNFSPKERYHLALFFFRLENSYESSEVVRWTYRNIRRMLWQEEERCVHCPWQSSAVTLSSNGRLLYCSPKSPSLGSTKAESAWALFRRNLPIRRKIIDEYCDGCIHDYHSDLKLDEGIRFEKQRYWKRRLAIERVVEHDERGPRRIRTRDDNSRYRVTITGWYGTETAGDKAILGQIVHEIRDKHPGSEIFLASVNPFLSKGTIAELGIEDVKIVRTHSRGFFHCIDQSDEIVMGGGPLMHLDDLGFVLAAFNRARKNRSKTTIWGCGIGPLDRGEVYREAVSRILNLSDSIQVRDSESAKKVMEMTGRTDAIVIGDPALKFVDRWRDRTGGIAEVKPVLGLYLREWSDEYACGLDRREFRAKREKFEDELGFWINTICWELNLAPRLVPMHHFLVGNDDRVFNRRFAKAHLEGAAVAVEQTPLSVDDILRSMASATVSVCMRFHSVVFAHSLGLPFVAIDYTNGGKIAGFLADQGLLHRCVSLDDIARGRWREFDLGKVLTPKIPSNDRISPRMPDS